MKEAWRPGEGMGEVAIRKGILHVDIAHFSPMFVIAILPIIGILREYEAGY